MNKNQTNHRPVETRHATSLQSTATKQQYVAPQVEIIDIELQCAFNTSKPDGTAPDIPGHNW